MSRDTVIVSKCQNIIGSTYTNIITASMGPKLFIYARYNIRESKIDRRDWYTANQITIHPSTNQVTDGRNMERFHTKIDRFVFSRIFVNVTVKVFNKMFGFRCKSVLFSPFLSNFFKGSETP